MHSRIALAVGLFSALPAPTQAIDNGLGLLPPMGWRSWNCYHGQVSQDKMEAVMDAMASRARSVDGKPTSLVDLGYANCGLDDNWQACGAGPLGFHDKDGTPLINTDTFPNMSAMTEHGHNLGIRVGWYMNNCICSEHKYTDTSTPTITQVMEKSAQAVADYGFDGVKLDGCSQFRNLTWWGALLNATGRHVLIENCHWGGTVPGDTSGDAPCAGTSTPSDCPYNFFRTSGDINPSWGSMFSNLQTTVKFSGEDGATALSRPGTWAYPDMLEVGNMETYEQDRAHFAAWAIISAPLILGLDLTNNDTVDKVWDIISNKEIIAVSQTWQGDPGHLVQAWNPKPPVNDTTPYAWGVSCDSTDATQTGFSLQNDNIVSAKGLCLDTASPTAHVLTFAKCDSSSTSQKFVLNADKSISNGNKCLDVYDFKGPVIQMFACNHGKNQQFTVNPDGKSNQIADASGQCLAQRAGAPSEGPATSGLQLWTKRLEAGSAAALVINAALGNFTGSFQLSDVGLDESKEYTIRDLYSQQDIGTASKDGIAINALASYDSRMFKLTPK